jgi:hypothetical protein
MDHHWLCACCGESNEAWIETRAGSKQTFVEDCRVCCRPNVITATFNSFAHRFDLSVYQEDIG